MSFTQNNIETVSKAVRAALGGQPLSPLNIANAVLAGMVAAGTFAFMRGVDKKKIVLFVLDEIITNDVAGEPAEKEALRSLLQTVIGGFVDLLVSASQGEYEFSREAVCCGWR
jgi:hypothetical protein